MKTNRCLEALLALAAISAARGETQARITIRVVNSAKVEERTLAQSEEQAGRVLAQAGIEVAWQDCPAGAGGACAVELGNCEFWLHVANWRPEAKSDKTLGFTVLDPDLARGTSLAGVYYPMVKQMALDFHMEEGPILGAAIAHEIGHVLGADHSPTGIMRARFNRHDVTEMSQGGLLFARDQAARIRAGVMRRTAGQSGSSSPPPR